ncbi:MAG: DUF4920 domain-containing protein [Vicinamibacteria bacterium]
MRTLLGLSFIALLATQASADAKTFGKPLTGLAPTTVAAVLAKPEAGQIVALEGTIKAVCAEKGCWLQLEQGKDNIHVSFEGYSFFVPKDSAGQKVKLEGRVLVKKRSAEEIEHLEGEGAKAAAASASIEATGVVIEALTK